MKPFQVLLVASALCAGLPATAAAHVDPSGRPHQHGPSGPMYVAPAVRAAERADATTWLGALSLVLVASSLLLAASRLTSRSGGRPRTA